MGTTSLSLGVLRLGHGVDLPPTSSAEVIERVELYFYLVFNLCILGQQRARQKTQQTVVHITLQPTVVLTSFRTNAVFFLRLESNLEKYDSSGRRLTTS